MNLDPSTKRLNILLVGEREREKKKKYQIENTMEMSLIHTIFPLFFCLLVFYLSNNYY